MSQRLTLTFDDPAALVEEFEKNLSKGGALVRTEVELPLRSFLEVELELRFASRRFVWEAEVVAVLPGTGVAVQFRRPASDLRDELEGAVGELPARAPAPAAEARADDPLSGVEDRRSAARTTARVPVRLDAPDGSVEGRTRDLSETGVLVSGDGNDLPVGQRVLVELQGPGGRALEVPGQVSRHVRSEGTVVAVAIAFEPEPQDEARLSRLVRSVKEQAGTRAADGISGTVEEVGLPNLLRMLGASSQGGTLTVVAGDEEGVLAFEDATLRYARQGALRGLKALERMLGWRQGRFHFHAGIDALQEEGEPMLLAEALAEARQRAEEGEAEEPLAPETCFRVAPGEPPAPLADDQTALAVLDLARAGMNVRRILDVIPESDVEIQRAIHALLRAGILAPRG